MQAFKRNVGTCRLDVKAKLEQWSCESRTDARHRGGSARSSVEVFVIKMERRG
jgi:hypothetical protein